MSSPEHAPHGPESAEKQPKDLERAPERLDRKGEVAAESNAEKERNVESAREEVNKEAISGRETNSGEHKKAESSPARTLPRSRDESYTMTMKQVQSEMSAPARAFSKFIHNKTVERTSEVIGSTVARPDALLSGSVFAFALVLGVYLLARYNGFSLSGFETIGAFILGWILGIIFDFLRAMITGKRS
jgi:hypothetical protein